MRNALARLVIWGCVRNLMSEPEAWWDLARSNAVYCMEGKREPLILGFALIPHFETIAAASLIQQFSFCAAIDSDRRAPAVQLRMVIGVGRRTLRWAPYLSVPPRKGAVTDSARCPPKYRPFWHVKIGSQSRQQHVRPEWLGDEVIGTELFCRLTQPFVVMAGKHDNRYSGITRKRAYLFASLQSV